MCCVSDDMCVAVVLSKSSIEGGTWRPQREGEPEMTRFSDRLVPHPFLLLPAKVFCDGVIVEKSGLCLLLLLLHLDVLAEPGETFEDT